MTDFETDVKAGNIYRKKVCDRCGAVDYEQFLGISGEGWEETPDYETHGFGSVVIVPYLPGVERAAFTLCPNCARVFQKRINQFLGISSIEEREQEE
jgi:hypothetical protein